MNFNKKDLKRVAYLAAIFGLMGLAIGIFGIVAIAFAVCSMIALADGLVWAALVKLIVGGLFGVVCWTSIIISGYVYTTVNVFEGE